MKAIEKERKMHNFTNRNCEVVEDNNEEKVRIKKERKSETVKEVDL